MGSALPANLHHNRTVATLRLSGPVGPVLNDPKTTRVSPVTRLATLSALLLVVLVSSGCENVTLALEDEIVFRPDGSGTARFTLSILRSTTITPVFEKLTQELRQRLPPSVTLRVREDPRWLHWDMTFSFQHVRQLNDTANQVLQLLTMNPQSPAPWTIVTLRFVQNRGWLRTTIYYAAELKSRFTSDGEFLGWTHTVVLPGRVQQTNGTVQGNRVSWKIGANQSLQANATSTLTNTAAVWLSGLLAVGLVGGGTLMWVRHRRSTRPQVCEQCGAPLPARARFCERCGTKVAVPRKSRPAPATDQREGESR